jgi:hypothetical protein
MIFVAMTNILLLSSLISLMSMSLEGVGLVLLVCPILDWLLILFGANLLGDAARP